MISKIPVKIFDSNILETAQRIVQKVGNHLVRNPKEDCFISYPDHLGELVKRNVISKETIEPSPVVKETKRLILNLLNRKKMALNQNNNEYTKLVRLSEKEGLKDNIEEIIQGIDRLKEGITDPIIKRAVIDKVASKNIYRWYDLNNGIAEWKKLADVDSSLHKRSYSLTEDNYKTIKYIKKQDETNKQLKEFGFPIEESLIDEIVRTPINKMPQNPKALLLENEIELASLKSYLGKYSKSDEDLTKYLYKKYYLPRLSPDTKSVCQNIFDEFNIKLFVEDESKPQAAQKVYNELIEWKKASKGEFYCMPVIDLSRYKSHYFENQNSGGFVPDISGSIINLTKDSSREYSLNIAEDSSVEYALRHELLHLNDEEYEIPRELHGIDVDAVINKSLYKDELLNAGIIPELIDYAYKDIREFKAVASQGDYSKYSPKFKEVLVKLGLPKYVFDMKPSNSDFVDNASYIAKIKQDNPNLKAADAIMSYLKIQSANIEELIKMPTTLFNYFFKQNH